jgi:hypothetical protein
MRFGQALRRIMTKIVRANPAFGPVQLGKYDFVDGYYRIQLNAKQAMNLACVLPPVHCQFYDRPLAKSDVYMDDFIGPYQPAAMPEITLSTIYSTTLTGLSAP